MLQDTHINAAQTLLKGQFPAVEGLESSLLIQTQRGFSCRVDETALHVQIHYLPSHAHWVTSARLPKAINLLVFDSKRGPTLSTALEQQLCQIHCPIEDSIDVLIPNLQQQQKGSNNCGLFAFAYATELCWHGEVAKEFEEKGMRKHLLKCLQEGLLSPFPGKTCKDVLCDTESIHVHCQCRMPDHFDENMVQCQKCDKWFHFKCVQVQDGDKCIDDEKWFCAECESSNLSGMLENVC